MVTYQIKWLLNEIGLVTTVGGVLPIILSQ